jgi:hypothetical protein
LEKSRNPTISPFLCRNTDLPSQPRLSVSNSHGNLKINMLPSLRTRSHPVSD